MNKNTAFVYIFIHHDYSIVFAIRGVKMKNVKGTGIMNTAIVHQPFRIFSDIHKYVTTVGAASKKGI